MTTIRVDFTAALEEVEICRSYADGESIKGIARDRGIRHETVIEILRANLKRVFGE